MMTNVWADSLVAAVRSAIDEEALTAGRADLNDRALERLRIAPGRVSGTVTARNSGAELRVAINLPVLTPDEVSVARTATPQCEHHAAGNDVLPTCLADPAHTGGVAVSPEPSELLFICTCAATTTCRHVAALAHALTDRLITHPEDFAVLRGLYQPQHPAQDILLADVCADAKPKGWLSAHHTWAWSRDRPDLPPVPEFPHSLTDEPPGTPAWAPPPAPAPAAEHLHALVNDAALQARNYLQLEIPLECAWEKDAVRLASRIPHASIPDIAERLDLDIADLRSRITAVHTSV